MFNPDAPDRGPRTNDPTAEEIEARSAEVQLAWSPRVRRRRRVGVEPVVAVHRVAVADVGWKGLAGLLAESGS